MRDFNFSDFEIPLHPSEKGCRALELLDRIRALVSGTGPTDLSGPFVQVIVDERDDEAYE